MPERYNEPITYKGKVMGDVKAIRSGPNGIRRDFSFESYESFRLMMAEAKPEERITFGNEVGTVAQLRANVLPTARQFTIKVPKR